MNNNYYIDIVLNGQAVKAKVIIEYRNGARASMTKEGLVFRMSPALTQVQQQEFIQKVIKKFSKLDVVKAKLNPKVYQNGDTLRVGSREYQLQITNENTKSHHARLLAGSIISLRLANDTPEHTQKSIRHLLSRIVANDFLPSITRRVSELNYQFFKKDITSVNIKLSQSNWGSCSNKGNLNFSSRLLFAPDEVVDYVIIHELAHLIELNHSDRFWKLVADAMPTYEQAEKWLKKNGHLCNF